MWKESTITIEEFVERTGFEIIESREETPIYRGYYQLVKGDNTITISCSERYGEFKAHGMFSLVPKKFTTTKTLSIMLEGIMAYLRNTGKMQR